MAENEVKISRLGPNHETWHNKLSLDFNGDSSKVFKPTNDMITSVFKERDLTAEWRMN